jgi:beta-phosphoglucomutase-like phosphatase (HAD superfamily)
METPRRHIDTYYALDLDRCLANTNKLQALLEKIVISETSLTRDAMHEAYLAMVKSGDSFDTITFLEEKLAASGDLEDLDRIIKMFIHDAQSVDMCEPNARELLRLLDEMNAPHGLVTFGGVRWQKAKIQVTHLEDIPSLVISTKEKSRLFATWRQPDGAYRLPHELSPGEDVDADSLVLIDDKAVSFKGITPGVSGIHVLPHNGSELLASQQGDLPERVIAVKGLAGVIELLKSGNVW